MTWEQVAAPHLNHKAFLKSVFELRCVDCAMTLVIHREPKTLTSSGPPAYKAPDKSQAASPEVVAFRKREAEAALELARQKRTTVVEDPS